MTYFYKLGCSFLLYMWLSRLGLQTSGLLLSTARSEIVFLDKPQLSSLSLTNLFLSDYTMHTIISYLNETPMPHISVQGKEKIFRYRKYAFFITWISLFKPSFTQFFFLYWQYARTNREGQQTWTQNQSTTSIKHLLKLREVRRT